MIQKCIVKIIQNAHSKIWKYEMEECNVNKDNILVKNVHIFFNFRCHCGHYLLGNKGAHIYFGNMTYKCDKCGGKAYKLRTNWQKHLCNICVKCWKSFTRKDSLQKHDCNTTISCNDCKRTYSSPKTLHNHKCTFCSKCKKIYASFKKKQKHACTVSTEI